jgi:hypothetical protein
VRRPLVCLVLLAGSWVTACSGTPSVETLTLSPAGGEVRTGDGDLRLIAPPSAVAQPATVTVQRVSSPTAGSLGPVFLLGPDDLTFAAPVTVVLFIEDADRGGRPFTSLRVATLDGNAHWATLGAPRSSQGQATVSGDTTRLGTFAVVAVPPPQDGGVPDAALPVDAGAGVIDGPGAVDAAGGGPGDACVQSRCDTVVPLPGTPCNDCGRPFVSCIDASPTTCHEIYCAGGFWQTVDCRDGGV